MKPPLNFHAQYTHPVRLGAVTLSGREGDDGAPRRLNPFIDALLRKNLTASMQKDETSFVKWVDYVLTTANTWKKPIKRFELVVERPKPDASGKYYYVSFCWDGKILQPDPDHFAAQESNFVPTRELSVAFFHRD